MAVGLVARSVIDAIALSCFAHFAYQNAILNGQSGLANDTLPWTVGAGVAHFGYTRLFGQKVLPRLYDRLQLNDLGEGAEPSKKINREDDTFVEYLRRNTSNVENPMNQNLVLKKPDAEPRLVVDKRKTTSKEISYKSKFVDTSLNLLPVIFLLYRGAQLLDSGSLRSWRDDASIAFTELSSDMDAALAGFYRITMGIYLSKAVHQRFMEDQGPGWMILHAHHVVAAALVYSSFVTQRTAIGTIVMFLHDMGDLALAVCQSARNLGWNQKNLGVPVSEALFGVLIAVWMRSRLYLFPTKVITSAFNQALTTREFGDVSSTVMLGFLQGLHVYWFGLMLGILRKIIAGGAHSVTATDDTEALFADSDASADSGTLSKDSENSLNVRNPLWASDSETDLDVSSEDKTSSEEVSANQHIRKALEKDVQNSNSDWGKLWIANTVPAPKSHSDSDSFPETVKKESFGRKFGHSITLSSIRR